MAQDWRRELQSEDPQIRAEAVKQIALSGNQDYLPFLKGIAENDPDPRLREYAKKAARHLYTLSGKEEPEKPSPAAATMGSQDIQEKAKDVAPSPLPEPKVPSKNRDTGNAKVQRALTLHMYGKPQKAIKALLQALEMNPDLEEDTYTKGVAAELTGQPTNLAIEALKDPSLFDASSSSAQEKDSSSNDQIGTTGSSMDMDLVVGSSSRTNLITAWLSFFGMSEKFFQAEERNANGEDTLISVLALTIAAVVIFMINGFFQFQQIMNFMNEGLPAMGTDLPPIDINIGMIFFVILIATVIMTPLSFYLSVGMQYLGGRLFGGSGTFKVHAFLMALIRVPMTVMSGVVTLLALVPVVNILAGLAGFGLSIYGIILTVRMVKVVHGLGTGQAVAAIIIPPVVLSVIGGCLILTIGSSLLGSLMQLQ